MSLRFFLSVFLHVSILIQRMSPKVVTCPATIPTVTYVAKCPSNEKEWEIAAEEKRCDKMAKYQNCTTPEDFVYHCILNKEATKLIEVCAPTWFMSGFCARFSITDERIVNKPGLDCTQFNPPCPPRFLSNSSAKYQSCYSKISSPPLQQCGSKEMNTQGSWTPTIVVVCIAILLLVLCFILYKRKLLTIKKCWKRTPNRHENPESPVNAEEEKLIETATAADTHDNPGPLGEETATAADTHDNPGPLGEGNTSNSTSEADDKGNTERYEDEKMDFKTLSGKSGQCSIKNLKTILDLKENLSKILEVDTNILWVVDLRDGVIFDDDSEFAEMKKRHNTIEVVVGNSDRKVQEPERDVISDKFIQSRRCEMSCAHLTTPDTLFAHTKDKLKSGDVNVRCPQCNRKWKMDELIEKSAMSEDENLFFMKLVSLNIANKKIAGNQWHR